MVFIVVLMLSFLTNGSKRAKIMLYNKPGTILPDAMAKIRGNESFSRLLRGTHTSLFFVSFS